MEEGGCISSLVGQGCWIDGRDGWGRGSVVGGNKIVLFASFYYVKLGLSNCR